MKCISNYKDLCIEIEVQEMTVRSIRNEIKELQKLMQGPKELTGIDYSKQPGGQPIYISLDKILDRLDRLNARLDVEERILIYKKKTKNEMDERVKNLTGLDQKVVYMRDIEGKTLQEISDELKYSKRWIEAISSRNKK